MEEELQWWRKQWKDKICNGWRRETTGAFCPSGHLEFLWQLQWQKMENKSRGKAHAAETLCQISSLLLFLPNVKGKKNLFPALPLTTLNDYSSAFHYNFNVYFILASSCFYLFIFFFLYTSPIAHCNSPSCWVLRAAQFFPSPTPFGRFASSAILTREDHLTANYPSWTASLAWRNIMLLFTIPVIMFVCINAINVCMHNS